MIRTKVEINIFATKKFIIISSMPKGLWDIEWLL